MLHFLCWHPRQVVKGNTPPQPTRSKKTLQQVIMQVQLQSCKAAGLEQVWESAISCQNGANGARMAYGAHSFPLPGTSSHSLTVNNVRTFHAWLGLAVGQAWEQKSLLATVGGVQWWRRPQV